jgi:hypothetical protein
MTFDPYSVDDICAAVLRGELGYQDGAAALDRLGVANPAVLLPAPFKPHVVHPVYVARSPLLPRTDQWGRGQTFVDQWGRGAR